MNKLFTAITALLIVAGSSCVGLKKLQRDDLLVATEKNNDFLNGRYVNWVAGKKGNNRNSLWYELSYKKNDTFKAPEHSTVSLEVSGSRMMKATLWQDSTPIKSITIKGKYSEGYFSAKHYYKTIPIPFIWYFTDDHKVRIGKIRNGNLVADAADAHSGWIFIVAAGFRNKYDATFIPVK